MDEPSTVRAAPTAISGFGRMVGRGPVTRSVKNNINNINTLVFYHKIRWNLGLPYEEGDASGLGLFSGRPRSRRRPLSATQHHPTTSLVGISWYCNEL